MNYTGKSGVQYNLSKKLASGGEGEIYDITGKPDCVAKIYKSGKANSEKENKLLKMANDPPNQNMLKQIAWPQDVLYEGSNFVGFIMPKLEINEDLNVIYEYGSTAKYKNMSWENRIIIAENLCAVLEAIHYIGNVCGDLNPKNITVNPNTGFVVFLDTDSYHIQDGTKTYRCDVGIPEYLPVEVQKKMRGGFTLATVDPSPFSKETDNFALAIHIFQLLMNGVHPFACAIIAGHSSVTAPQPNDNIEKGMFPFMQNVPGIKIPTFAPEIVILPDNIQKLFRRAFVDGHITPTDRPKPQDWRTALSSLRQQGLKTCSQVSCHQFNRLLVNCPWCKADKAYNDFLNKTYVPPQQVKISTPTAPYIPVTPNVTVTSPRPVTPPNPPITLNQPTYVEPKKKPVAPIIIAGIVAIIIIIILMNTNSGSRTTQSQTTQNTTQTTTQTRFVRGDTVKVRQNARDVNAPYTALQSFVYRDVFYIGSIDQQGHAILYRDRNYSQLVGRFRTSDLTKTTQATTSRPSVPTGLRASAITSTTCTLNWNTVNGATGYHIYWSSTLNGNYVRVGNLTTPSPRDIIQMGRGSNNYFKVSAFNSAGESAQSQNILVTTRP